MDFILSKLALIGPFFLLLGILVFVHEWGHFIVARMCGVQVKTFSIGFGPKLFRFKWGDTTYALSAIPLGGYVKMYGDGVDESIPKDREKSSFLHQNIWEKIAIVSGGPLTNLIFAFFIFMFMGWLGVPTSKTVLGDIDRDSPAQQAGLRYGDEIVSVNGVEISNAEEFTIELSKSLELKAHLELKRDGEIFTFLVPLMEQENLNPLLQMKTVKVVDGLNLMRVSNLVGLDHKSKLVQTHKTNQVEKIIQIGDVKTPDLHSIRKALSSIPITEALKISFETSEVETSKLEVETSKLETSKLETSKLETSELETSEVETSKLETSKLEASKTDKERTLLLLPPETLHKSPLESLSEIQKGERFWTLEDVGIKKSELFIANVQRGSPANIAGLKPNDQILKINTKSINEWEQLLETVKSTPKDQTVTFTIARPEGVQDIEMVPKQTEILKPNGQLEYRPTVGIMPSLEYLPPPQEYVRIHNFGSLIAFAYSQSIKWVTLTVKGLKQLLFGEISHKNLSGVISIGKVAKDSLDIGWSYFLQIMAIISINLFLLNLLPVPVLDGGHLLFYFIEVIKGSPVSMTTRLIGQQIGVVVILSLVAYTIFNDLSRIVFSGW